jgi:hypothetical protein
MRPPGGGPGRCREDAGVMRQPAPFAFARWRELRCAFSATLLLLAGCGSATKTCDDVEVEQIQIARLDASSCQNYGTEDDNSYCTIVAIDGMPPGNDETGYFGLLPGEHKITVRNEQDVGKEIVEMSFVAKSGHWYAVAWGKTVRFPQWQFVIYDNDDNSIAAHVGQAQ